jgi:hypothetical protein
MPEKIRLFVKILTAELEDLEDDLRTWGQYLDEKHRADKISEYVFLENSALLRRELAGIRTMVQAIADNHPANLPDLESIKEYYTAFIQREAAQYQFQEAIVALVKKKIEKVFRYLSA